MDDSTKLVNHEMRHEASSKIKMEATSQVTLCYFILYYFILFIDSFIYLFIIFHSFICFLSFIYLFIYWSLQCQAHADTLYHTVMYSPHPCMTGDVTTH